MNYRSFISYQITAVLVLWMFPLFLSAKVLPLNEKKVPKTKEDLLEIQSALIENLAQARKATVSIRVGEGFGSGVIVSPDGLVLTAAHVTAGVDKDLTVILNDGTRLKAVSMGLVSNTDAAMMRITEKRKDEQPFSYVEINRENDYRLGDWVFALGHSGGFDQERGPVVRLGRIVRDTETTIQTDCKVIGGDSGGPLFDLTGHLIAIHSRVSASVEQNMHIPMREYLSHWKEMEENQFLGNGPFAKKPVKGSGFIGFASTDTDDGVTVTEVLKGSPAEKAGLQVGDVITKLDDTKISAKKHLVDFLKEKAEGDRISLTYVRRGKEQTSQIQLTKK